MRTISISQIIVLVLILMLIFGDIPKIIKRFKNKNNKN